MTTPALAPHDTQETIATIARLLHHAAARAAEGAAAQGPRSVGHVHALGIHLLAAETALLVPREIDPYWPRPTQEDPTELLRIAEQLARSVPVNDTTVGFSSVVVGIADLLREATS
ncbi:hypothetical protein [Luteipulveratus halotolerans]|uniref:Uncharacterized protein n=1 Tax=Luteipulveratus halotolerans TaxID=1631356 RepID=A0A0L6CD72_9MICO|nr:hypothetical protein [Luteipulveratus halotolerans]KNX35841.1 hypothetical protein VV01_21360 [Luteipulveratus halotolerans]KNX35936.1 hypothetical protein VV01_22035 [Luteipulveratus halotolerans]